MKAAAFLKTGGPEVIEFLELPDPVPGPDEVLIRTKAIGLNFADIYRRSGVYSSESPSPFVLGYEGAGVIVALGNEVKEFSKGQYVGFAHVARANAELVKAPAWKVIPLPKGISYETAASLLLQGMTAHYLTHDSYRLKSTDTVLIHSASGGVGLLLVQISKMTGARVIGTVSSPNKVAMAKAAGADEVIIRSNNWKSEVLKSTNQSGVDVAYDAIGSTLLDTLSVIKTQVTCVYYGQAGGVPPRIDPNLLMADSKILVGGELWSHIDSREKLLKRAGIIFLLVEQGKIHLTNVTKYPLARTREAHEALESGRTQGKIILMND